MKETAKCTFVLGLMAVFKLSTFVRSTNVISKPNFEATLRNSRFVPPYISSLLITLSPCFNKPKTAVVAPKPDENANPYFPLSSFAITFSSTSLVGFPDRPYSYFCN